MTSKFKKYLKIIVDTPIILVLFFHMSKKSELNVYTYF